MTLSGKGYYIWMVKTAQGGKFDAIADQAVRAGLTHVLIKVADGVYNYNITKGVDMCPPLVAALRARGIQPWGWQYIYGVKPVDEARRAAERFNQLGLDGFIVNAEAQFKAKGMAKQAHKYMQELRRLLPNKTIGLSTYRYPNVHYQFPFTAFLGYCDLNMPQIYWIGSVNPAQQLRKSYSEYKALGTWRTFIPTGAAFNWGSWSPTPGQVHEFLTAARELQLPAANFWEWKTAEERPELWNTVRDFNWSTGSPAPAPTPAPQPEDETPPPQEQQPAPSPKPDIITRYMSALNSGDPGKVTVLYEKNEGKHIYGNQTRKGRTAIYAWYNTLLKKSLPNGKFTLIDSSFDGTIHRLQWSARGTKGKVMRGKDSFKMSAANPNQISIHTTEFKLLKSFEIDEITPDPEAQPAP